MELQYGPNKIWMENEAGTVVAEVDFVERNDGNYDIVHTFVDDSLRGQGAAAKLVKAAADEIRRRHKKIHLIYLNADRILRPIRSKRNARLISLSY